MLPFFKPFFHLYYSYCIISVDLSSSSLTLCCHLHCNIEPKQSLKKITEIFILLHCKISIFCSYSFNLLCWNYCRSFPLKCVYPDSCGIIFLLLLNKLPHTSAASIPHIYYLPVSVGEDSGCGLAAQGLTGCNHLASPKLYILTSRSIPFLFQASMVIGRISFVEA